MRVEGHGLSLMIPSEWDGRVTREAPDSAVVLEATSTRLAPSRSETQRAMGKTDVYFSIIDSGVLPFDVQEDESWSEAGLPIQFGYELLSPFFENVELPAFGVQFRVVNGRCLSMYLGFGPHPSRGMSEWPQNQTATVPVDEKTLGEANEILATLAVQEADF